MSPEQIREYLIARFPDITMAENFGYTFFFVGEDQTVPFATIAESDNDYDRVSNLDREGAFRLNIGASRERFRELFPDDGEVIDYTVLNTFLPHPHYAAQHFLCILNPEGENLEIAMEMLGEAHDIAARRQERRTK